MVLVQAMQEDSSIESVPLTSLDPAPGDNPNVMPVERYALLKAAIESGDFYQPILVRPTPSCTTRRFTIVDGMHRWKAAVELGYASIPAVVAPFTEHEATAVRIAMNRLRGDLDLGVVSRQVADLKMAGWNIDALTLTGFGVDEVNDLLRSSMSSDDLLDDAAATVEGELEEAEATPRPFVLELTFGTRAELTKAKKGLRKAAGGGKGADMAVGLINLIDGG